MASDHFIVTLQTLFGDKSTEIDCTPNTTIQQLINKFHETYRDNKRKSYLKKLDSLEELTGTLGENNITGDTTLIVVYREKESDISDIIKCINPNPIAEKLHHFIEDHPPLFGFKAVKGEQVLQREIDCTTIVTEHNNWTINTECLFFLTTTRNSDSEIWVSDEIKMPPPNKKDAPYVGPIKYISGFEAFKRTPMTYTYSETQHDDREREVEPQTLRYQHMTSIKGTLDSIVLQISNKNVSAKSKPKSKSNNTPNNEKLKPMTYYQREFQIYVILKGPIEICDPDGTVKYSSDDLTARCRVMYDSIMICNSTNDINQQRFNKLKINQGGKRTKRTCTKRTYKKRKAHRRTHKKRA